MPRPLEVALRGGEPDEETGLSRFDPGASVQAIVSVPPLERPARGLTVQARWRASGAARSDEGGGEPMRVGLGGTPHALGGDLPVEIRLPLEPWSYVGEIVRIDWRLEATIDQPGLPDLASSAPFILAPPPLERPSFPGAATAKQTGT